MKVGLCLIALSTTSAVSGGAFKGLIRQQYCKALEAFTRDGGHTNDWYRANVSLNDFTVLDLPWGPTPTSVAIQQHKACCSCASVDAPETFSWVTLFDGIEVKIPVMDEGFDLPETVPESTLQNARSTAVYTEEAFIPQDTGSLAAPAPQPLLFLYNSLYAHPSREGWGVTTLTTGYRSDVVRTSPFDDRYNMTQSDFFESYPPPLVGGHFYFTTHVAPPRECAVGKLAQFIDYTIYFDTAQQLADFWTYYSSGVLPRLPKLPGGSPTMPHEVKENTTRFQYGNEFRAELPDGRGLYLQRWAYYYSKCN